MSKNNSELLNNLGNFINRFSISIILLPLNVKNSELMLYFFQRALAFCEKNMDAVIPPIHLTNEDAKTLAKINHELVEYKENLDKIK